MLDFLIERAKEPSTYAGLGVALGDVGLHVTSPEAHAIAGVCMAVAGLIAVFAKERKAAPAAK